MPYKLYLDKSENFECDVSVKNASLREAFARIIIESADISLMFPGYIKNGKCYVICFHYALALLCQKVYCFYKVREQSVLQ